MKKNLISRLFMPVAILVAMASCTEKAAEYTAVIPAEASAVVGINVQSLIDKSGVSDEDKQMLIDALNLQQMEKIIKDGSESGLSVKDPIYFFTDSQTVSAGIVAKMNNIEKFNQTLKALLPEIADESITEADGYKMIDMKGEGICAFNESLLLMLSGSKNDTETVAKLMTQGKENSFAQTEYFKSMSDKKGDITFFASLSVIPETYKRQMNMPFSGIKNIDLKDIAYIGGLSFEKGKIALQIEVTSNNKEVKELYKKQDEIYGKLDGDFLANFPVSTLMYISLNVDGEKMYNMFQENKVFGQYFPAEKLEQWKDLFAAFDGDFSAGLTDITMNDAPTFIVYGKAKSSAVLNTLYESRTDLGLGRGEEIVKLAEDQYVLKSRQMNLYFGYKDKYMYATSNEQAYKNIGNKEEKSLKDAAYASNMNGKRQYVVVDVEAILNLPLVKMVAAMGGREAANYIDKLSKISYLEAFGEGYNQSNMNLVLVDKDTNALEQIVNIIKQFN